MPQADVLFHYGLGLFLYIKETNNSYDGCSENTFCLDF